MRCPPLCSSEGVLRGDLHQTPAQLERSGAKVLGWSVGCALRRCVGRCVAQLERGLRGVSRAKAVERMVDEVESGDAQAKIAIAAHTETLLQGEVSVEERRAVSIRLDIGAVGSGCRQSEAGGIEELMRTQMRGRVAFQNRLEVDVGRAKDGGVADAVAGRPLTDIALH